jgi:glycosyltransferase involved in cell wall biosynthesis
VTIRLAHVWSSDLGIPPSLPFCLPLKERRWEITFFSPDGPHVADARAAGMEWKPLALDRTIDFAADLRGTAKLARDLRAGQFHIVHTHNIKVGLISRVVATMLRTPIIVHTMHGLAYSMDTPVVKRTAHALLEKIASARVDAILSQSEEDRATILATHVIAPEKIHLIGNGIDLSKFAFREQDRRAARAELGIADEDVLFLSAGRLVREKGFVELFEAAARARSEDRRVRVAVAGPLDEQKADALPRAILDDARAKGVLLLGRRTDMPRLYAAADVVTLASWREGMPRVLMEGAAMGRPLLASDARGCRECVRPPRNGLLVSVRDPGALSAAMVRMAGDPAMRATLGAENAREARERYDLHAVVARVVEVYEELVGSRQLS